MDKTEKGGKEKPDAGARRHPNGQHMNAHLVMLCRTASESRRADNMAQWMRNYNLFSMNAWLRPAN